MSDDDKERARQRLIVQEMRALARELIDMADAACAAQPSCRKCGAQKRDECAVWPPCRLARVALLPPE